MITDCRLFKKLFVILAFSPALLLCACAKEGRVTTKSEGATPAPAVVSAGGAGEENTSVPVSAATKAHSTNGETPKANPRNLVAGTWRHTMRDSNGQAMVLCWVKASVQGDEVKMEVIRSAIGTIPAVTVYNVDVSATRWNFDSDWGGGRVGKFRLKKVDDNTFTGAAFENGEQVQDVLWERVDANFEKVTTKAKSNDASGDWTEIVDGRGNTYKTRGAGKVITVTNEDGWTVTRDSNGNVSRVKGSGNVVIQR